MERWRAEREMRRPDLGLAVLRIVVGFWFAKSLVTKLDWSRVLPRVEQRWIDFLPKRLQEYVDSNPPEWYREFLVSHALPNSDLFARLTAVGEVLIGLGLLLGLLTVLSSLGGLWLISNYLVASSGEGLNPQGFHILLIASMLVFIATRAGRRLGLDGWLVRNAPRSRLVHLLC